MTQPATSLQAYQEVKKKGKVELHQEIIINVLTYFGPLAPMQISERSGMIGPYISYSDVMRRISEIPKDKVRKLPTRGPAPSGENRAFLWEVVKQDQ